MTFPNVQRILADVTGVFEDQIAPGTKLSKENGLTATNLAKLILRLERTYKITIHDEDVSDFQCVSDISDYLDDRLSDGQNDYAPPSDRQREAWYYE